MNRGRTESDYHIAHCRHNRPLPSCDNKGLFESETRWPWPPQASENANEYQCPRASTYPPAPSDTQAWQTRAIKAVCQARRIQAKQKGVRVSCIDKTRTSSVSHLVAAGRSIHLHGHFDRSFSPNGQPVLPARIPSTASAYTSTIGSPSSPLTLLPEYCSCTNDHKLH